jgi:sporulation protein YlmC with PRC-barrel domain
MKSTKVIELKREYMITEQIIERENMTGKNREGIHPNNARFLTASTVIGDKIENPKGEKLGHIKDVMLDIQLGKIEYVIMEFGGFLGLGEKLFAIPFSALKLNTHKHSFIVDWDKETLKKAPGFDKHHWPSTNRHFEEVNSYWGSFMGPNTGVG